MSFNDIHRQCLYTHCFIFISFFFKYLVEKKGSWSKQKLSLKLRGSTINEIPQPTSDLSFAQELFDYVYLDDIIPDIKSLSNEVLLNQMIITADAKNTKYGKVFVTEVTVTCKNNQLTINHKVYTLCM